MSEPSKTKVDGWSREVEEGSRNLDLIIKEIYKEAYTAGWLDRSDAEDEEMNIESIREEKKQLLERVHKLDAVINAFQEVCKHEMVYTGHDSHYDWYECKICGKSERE